MCLFRTTPVVQFRPDFRFLQVTLRPFHPTSSHRVWEAAVWQQAIFPPSSFPMCGFGAAEDNTSLVQLQASNPGGISQHYPKGWSSPTAGYLEKDFSQAIPEFPIGWCFCALPPTQSCGKMPQFSPNLMSSACRKPYLLQESNIGFARWY